ncbi:uncharacterized protein IUM83_06564 [Phytophthora cinnamomi]|uniref:uncharacterized protein n=1 Tax=Phytophthora cinnamomi TaxID=4785 RepID=UPI00355A1E68|nr:hypothetical protein IUM83_06564 [Phytophthora cinnamomi]
MPSKKRKSAHVVREGLNEELRRLREQLKQLNPIAGLGSENAAIFRAIRQQQLNLASAQSAILPLLQTSGFAQNLHPLHSQIRLGKSWESRRATLLAFRETKFRAAYEYITALTQTTNSDELRHSDERFETAGGDICCVISQTIHFPGVRSLKQVYESLIFSLNNAEISISERLGNVTVRDDYGDVNGNTFNSRIMSTGESGITTELNCVMLSQLFDDASDVCGGQPCGMVIIDSVDEDDLYPYIPNERIRKDVSSVFLLTDRRCNIDNSGPDSGVILKRIANVKLHRPAFELSESVWHDQQLETTRWGDVVVRSMRSVLYSRP